MSVLYGYFSLKRLTYLLAKAYIFSLEYVSLLFPWIGRIISFSPTL